MIIEVTQDDIDKGEPRACLSCPVTLALNRITGEECHVGSYIRIPNFGTFNYPGQVIEFINNFDMGRPVNPFSFELHATT